MDDAPILATACPFLRYIYHGKIEHFQQTVICREYGLGLRHLTELAVEAFYGIGGIDKPPEFRRVLEIGAEIRPVVAPGLGNLGVFLVPPVGETLQRCRGRTFIRSGVNLFQVSHKLLQILVAHVLAGIAELVDYAVLHLCLGKHCLYCSGKAREVQRKSP